MALRIKSDIDLKELEKFGFEQSRVAVYPKKLVKVVDWENKKVLEICNDKPNKNIWSGKDVNNVGEIWLCDCKELKISNYKILLEPNVKEHLYYETTYGTAEYEKIEKYIYDLIKADLVEKVSDGNE